MSKEKREQGDQIREVLSSLPTLQIGEDVYLKLENILDATRNILYPEGLTTKDEYKRLVAISKAGCKAIGYGCQEVELLPPAVSFSQRGKYIKKMPTVSDKVIEELIEKLAGENNEWTSKPYIIIRREKLARHISIFHLRESWKKLSPDKRQYLMRRGDEVACKLGWSKHSQTSVWEEEDIAYVLPIKPDLEACRKALIEAMADYSSPCAAAVLRAGRRAAFGRRCYDQDPEELISYETWRQLFDELGYIYQSDQEELIPKPLNLPPDAQETLMTAISSLGIYNHPQIGSFLIKDELVQAIKGVLEISKGRLDHLIAEGLIGRVLIKLGYQLTTRWLNRYEFQEAKTSPPAEFGAEVFSPAIVVSREMETPAFASGFRIHSPVLLRDEHTLVYMELLGPRQAVKANWAALRQRNRSHYLFGRVLVKKEDKVTTLKTTLPCGWDHWCLIHRQASYQKLTPNETFYLISHTYEPKGAPSTFIAFLAKSLAIPILPQWAEYLWVEGRMKELITPLSEGCYGYGGWKVETDQWSQVVSEGLAEGHISF